jgi:hypothetical protein
MGLILRTRRESLIAQARTLDVMSARLKLLDKQLEELQSRSEAARGV